MSKNRILASIISNDTNKVKSTFTDSDSIVNSASLGVTAAAGTATYSSPDTLPVSANDGDQALVTSTNRLFIYSGSGWYNIALINNTPYWSTEAASSYDLNTTGTATTITILAVDSDGIQPVYTATADSDFNQIATLSRDSDNGRIFTIVPIDSEGGTAVSGTGTITFKASDGISLVSTLSTFNLTFITNIVNSKYTTFLSKADTAGTDNQVDASASAHAITESGPITSTAFSPYHPGGYSTYFDGSGDNITISNFAMAGDVTFEFWFYQDVAQSTSYRCMLGASTYGGSSPFTLYTYGSNVAIWLAASGGPHINGAFTAFTWHHMAMVRNSGTWTLYIDGVSTGTSTSSGSYDFAATTDWRFGENHSGSYDWKGYIRDARFVNGTAVYTSAFTPPTEPLTAITNTELLTCHLPYIADGSTNGHAITINGNTRNKRIGPYDYVVYSKADHGGSVYFDDAANTYMVTGPNNHADFGMGTGDWTVEMWIWVPSGYTQANNYIVDIGANGLIFRLINNKFTYTNSTLGFSGDLLTTGADFTNDTWHHMAVCRISGTVKMYMNGKLTATETDTHSSSSEKVWFGRYGGGVSYQYTGYVSDLRIVKGTGVYTSNFTPPTQPLTAITNTVLLTCTNKNDIWDVANGKRINRIGTGPTVSNTQRKFASSSALYFAGSTGNYLLKDLGETIGTRDFTAEAWVYPTTTGAQHVFQISNQTDGHQVITSQNTQVGIGLNNGFWRYGTTGWNYGYVHTTTAVVVNTWHHVAYVRTGGYSKLYLNGTEIHSNADTSNYSARYLAYGVGHQSNNMWSGYTQGLRIDIGYARYTSNFTPPTEEFEG